jgi:hypothetical protein
MFNWHEHEQAIVKYQKLFGADRKARTYRGRSGRKLDQIEGLTRSEALHWLAHHPKGAALMQATDTPISELADLLVEASNRATNKREEAPKMNINKTLREVGEHNFTRMIEKYAATVRQPNETKEQAFVRVFTADDEEGQALRKCWRISKQGVPVAEPDEEAVADEEEADKDEKEDEDARSALEALNELAAEERRRNPKLTKAQAFAKAYQDPANARLAQRERQQNRPR